jgi:mannose-6-phosphate isomerase
MRTQFKRTCCGTITHAENCDGECPRCGSKGGICEEVPKRERVFMNPPPYSGDKKYEKRDWGHFEVLLDEPKLKIKKIVVKNGKRLSLQLHELRDERWFIAGGCGEVQIGNETIDISEGDELFIAKYQVHRVRSAGLEDLVIIEIQTGVCNEDDIIRIEDDFGRVN